MDKISQENTDLKMRLIDDFNNFEASLNGQSNNGMHSVRQDALAYINENGFLPESTKNGNTQTRQASSGMSMNRQLQDRRKFRIHLS